MTKEVCWLRSRHTKYNACWSFQQGLNKISLRREVGHLITWKVHLSILKVLLYLIALLITSDHPDCLDEGMTGVVHTSLNALVKSPIVWGNLVPQLGINGRGQRTGHTVVVFAKVREVSTVEERNVSYWVMFCLWPCGRSVWGANYVQVVGILVEMRSLFGSRMRHSWCHRGHYRRSFQSIAIRLFNSSPMCSVVINPGSNCTLDRSYQDTTLVYTL